MRNLIASISFPHFLSLFLFFLISIPMLNIQPEEAMEKRCDIRKASCDQNM